MGIRAGVSVSVTSFLLGALFTHWIADSLTLWKSPVTDQHLWTAAAYYSILAKVPSQIFYFLAAVAALGFASIFWSLNDLRAGNIMFDGGSILLFGTTIVMYLHTVLPSTRIFTTFIALPSHNLLDPIPHSLRIATLDLASDNLICSVALTGVLALQAGRSWAERLEDGEEDDEELVFVEADDVPAPSATVLRGKKSRARTPEIGISEDKVKPLLQARVQPS